MKQLDALREDTIVTGKECLPAYKQKEVAFGDPTSNTSAFATT